MRGNGPGNFVPIMYGQLMALGKNKASKGGRSETPEGVAG